MNVPSSCASLSTSPHRLASLDVLRGVVILLMSLDHTRDFFSAAHFDPTDLSRTTPALFLTRWITHFCAPVFIFLSGVAAFLSTRSNPNYRALRRFLRVRGLWIIALGLSLESFIWTPTPDFSLLSGAVLWAIGWSMLFLSILVQYQTATVLTIGLVMIASHNAFDAVQASTFGSFAPLWSILHTREVIQLTPTWRLEPYYPLIPWLGVMATGYGFGPVLLLETQARRRLLSCLGGLLIVLFIVLRYSGWYGDPAPWQMQTNMTYSILAFLNCQKYPPSLLYLMMTLGPALICLAYSDQLRGPIVRILMVFGRVPLFYYILHLPYILILALLLARWHDGAFPNIYHHPFTTTSYGYSLPIVYLLWLGVMLTLYPLCRRFASIKSRYPENTWLRLL